MRGDALLMSLFLTTAAAIRIRDYRALFEMLMALPQLSALSLSGAPAVDSCVRLEVSLCVLGVYVMAFGACARLCFVICVAGNNFRAVTGPMLQRCLVALTALRELDLSGKCTEVVMAAVVFDLCLRRVRMTRGEFCAHSFKFLIPFVLQTMPSVEAV